MKQARDKIKQYQKKIEQTLEKERLLAKELLKNGKKEYVYHFQIIPFSDIAQKPCSLLLQYCICFHYGCIIVTNFCSRALLLLRKKRFQEQVLSRTDGHLENLERMTHDLEFAQIEMKVVDGLKVGNNALKQLHALLSIDEIEKVMDETREGIDKQKEIDEILSGALTEEDEGEVQAELDALLEAEIAEKTPEVPEDVLLPEVPEDLPEVDKSRTKEKIQEPVAVTA